MRTPWSSLFVALAIAASADPARAVPVDGMLDPAYGLPLAIQTTQTSLGDQPADWLYGAELDGAYAFVADDTLHLLVTGSFNRFISEPLAFARQLQLYFDTGPGGQAPLAVNNPDVGNFVHLPGMAGLGFDADFAPDFYLAGARDSYDGFFVHYAELPAGGGGAGYFVGLSTIGGDGTLSGMSASNPHGIRASVDISNVAGVTAGCDASSGAAVTTGAEWTIPLAALGHPAGAIKVCALLAYANAGGGWIGNQVLGPVPPGTCTLGLASGVDFAALAGAQYFVIEHVVPALRTTWGRLKSAYR